jgi:glycyl-tRNA synthetase beta chain
VAVSLADKLDTIAGFFMQDLRPTGSKDPFALRRAALGILALVFAAELRGELTVWLIQARKLVLAQHPDVAGQCPIGETIRESILAVNDQMFMRNVEEFIRERLKMQQRDAGVRHDLIDAAFSLYNNDNKLLGRIDTDLVRLLALVHALQAFIVSDDGTNLLAVYKRAANILRIEEKRGGGAFEATTALDYEPQPEEAALLAVLDSVEPRASAAVEAEDFEGAMAALSHLRAPIDAFFDKVTVNDADPARRLARLGLLARIRDAVHRVADFSRIEG